MVPCPAKRNLTYWLLELQFVSFTASNAAHLSPEGRAFGCPQGDQSDLVTKSKFETTQMSLTQRMGDHRHLMLCAVKPFKPDDAPYSNQQRRPSGGVQPTAWQNGLRLVAVGQSTKTIAGVPGRWWPNMANLFRVPTNQLINWPFDFANGSVELLSCLAGRGTPELSQLVYSCAWRLGPPVRGKRIDLGFGANSVWLAIKRLEISSFTYSERPLIWITWFVHRTAV